MHRSAQYFENQESLSSYSQLSASSLVKVLVACVLVLSILLIGTVIRIDINGEQTKFDEHVGNLRNHVYSTLLTNQTILESFAALLSVVGPHDKTVMVQYVHNLVQRHSKIYLIETVNRIKRSQIDEVAQQQKEMGNQYYKLKAYVYNSKVHFVDVEDKAFYYPIVFMEPATVEQRERAMGLDIESISFLRRAMVESIRGGSTVMSRPFELVEGDFGYVMLHPTTRKASIDADEEQLLALLVIRAIEMLPDNLSIFPGTTTILRHPAYLPQENEGILLNMVGELRGNIESLLFPKLTYSNLVGYDQQQFELDVEWQLGWTSISWALIGLVVMLAVVLTTGVFIYGGYYRKNEENLERARYGLFIMTYYDSLTQLPNRPHLLSHLHNILINHHSPEFKLRVMCIEVKGLDSMVSLHGEVVGDMLLVTLSSRIRKLLSETDFFACIARTKFIVLFENSVSAENLSIAENKIITALNEPVFIDNNKIEADTSTGIAVYPDDGLEVKDLIKRAIDSCR